MFSSFLFLQLVPKLFPFVFMYNISINTQIIIMNKKCR
ncbi:putative membrane protein [Bacteroides fragilis str. 3719 A10]|nr:putative membrane protein [Bacteroides fragilis str. 3397 T10]EXZ47008.1 putative membrane protein [Bacteroides fragilis str. 3397 N2]EXZ51840.1 putative membrane protein [Bacteroides fragilis str. 3397 T14]EXZ56307.1 putative membrane protein [Bacteroides fragilis str. 3719 A10]EYA41757.1 putative membrane protein [Bacteroides fragilis str. 3397 N3]